MATRYIDRSRILSYLRCPRERWLNYHFNGTGITSGQLRVPLGTGTHVHAGLEALLKGAGVESAVSLATSAYQAEADAALSAMSTHLDHYDYTVEEQVALVEALVRVYAIKGLPALLADYEVIEVESEYEWPLAPGQIMMSRLDGLLRRRNDGGLYVLSFKTDTGARLDDKLPDAQLDLQGLTEPLAMLMTRGDVAAGVKMEWLVKGSWKEEVRGNGLHYQDSYLVRPYRRDLAVTGAEWAWQYYTPCPGIEHKILGGNGRLWTCKGDSRTHGLGPSWERVPVWRHMPIKEWVDILAAVPPEQGNPLGGVLYLPPPIMRRERDMYSAKRTITALERSIDERLAILAQHTAGTQPMIEALDVVFPATGAYTNQCNHSFGGTCQFYPVCHSADPALALASWGSLGYQPRTPHHEPELIAIKGV